MEYVFENGQVHILCWQWRGSFDIIRGQMNLLSYFDLLICSCWSFMACGVPVRLNFGFALLSCACMK